jgi:dolichyl-phosphate beta-glucosyltransferase
MPVSLSLVVPAYNEAQRLPATLRAADAALPKLAAEAEIIVVDDGSRDGTAEVARRTLLAVPLRVIELGRNRGKGAAVAAGIGAARFPLVAFTDADCPYDLDSLRPMLDALASGRADVAIGARDLPDSQINRGYGLLRHASGKVLSALTWLAIGLPFRDSQCGLKAFRADVARELFAMRTIDGFGFDFELLAIALENGKRVERFPVRLTHSDDSRIALLRDSAKMLRELWRVGRSLRRGAYRLPPVAADATACPLCGGDDFVPRVARDGFRMVACRACGLWYLNPMPAQEALEQLYGQESYFASEAAQHSGYADYSAMADDFRATFRRRLDLVRAHVGRGRLLDVGGGYGYLADAARSDFVERWVVEVSGPAAERVSPEHRVVVGAWEDVDLPRDYFDVVSLQDCFEHLRDPRAALTRARSVLRDGGALLLVTPNVESWLSTFQGRNWVSLKFPEHVALYSRRTLRRALEDAGFDVQAVLPARQYARLDFLAERAASAYPRLGAALARGARWLGGASARIYVPSGSLAVVATAGRAGAGSET